VLWDVPGSKPAWYWVLMMCTEMSNIEKSKSYVLVSISGSIFARETPIDGSTTFCILLFSEV
jgi:hypothetical protein